MVISSLLLVIVAVIVLAILTAHSRRIPGGQLGRIARLGRLSGRLATSRLGAMVRRTFMRKAPRARTPATVLGEMDQCWRLQRGLTSRRPLAAVQGRSRAA